MVMKGRAHELLRDLQKRLVDQPFVLATVILQAHVTPARVTPQLDAPEIEHRLAQALTQVRD
jgi:hypothetical protein